MNKSQRQPFLIRVFEWLIKSEIIQYEKDIIEQYMGGGNE